MNDIQIFKKQELGQVRVAGDKDNPLFCLRDVCEILGIAQTKDVKASIIREFGDDGDLIYPIVDKLGRTQQATFITEPQLYFILMRSDKPKAKPFRQWVVNEVLPSIRKTGAYNAEQKAPTNMIEALELALAQAKEIEILNDKIELDKPKVAFAEAVTNSNYCITITELSRYLQANGINIGRNKLYEYLRDNGYLIKGGRDKNLPTQKYVKQGLFKVVEGIVDYGTYPLITKNTLVTGKGQQYFLNKFLAYE